MTADTNNTDTKQITSKFDTTEEKEMKSALKHKLLLAVLALLIAIIATAAVTFAWYIYNTNSRTTKVHMAAGSTSSLEIANTYQGTYGSSCDLSSFTAVLNPVSTDNILNGFQKVYGFTDGSENQSNLIASLFGPSDTTDYYETTVFLRTNAKGLNIYVSDIGFKEKDEKNPISTAIRIGLVVHEQGKHKPVADQYIFEISNKKNPQAEYNTATGEEGYVLDSTRTDGTTLPFKPYTKNNFVDYDKTTGVVTVYPGKSLKIGSITGTGTEEFGEPVQVDIYIWLEGCDSDCVNNICGKTLSNVAVSFAGSEE